MEWWHSRVAGGCEENVGGIGSKIAFVEYGMVMLLWQQRISKECKRKEKKKRSISISGLGDGGETQGLGLLCQQLGSVQIRINSTNNMHKEGAYAADAGWVSSVGFSPFNHRITIGLHQLKGNQYSSTCLLVELNH